LASGGGWSGYWGTGRWPPRRSTAGSAEPIIDPEEPQALTPDPSDRLAGLEEQPLHGKTKCLRDGDAMDDAFRLEPAGFGRWWMPPLFAPGLPAARSAWATASACCGMRYRNSGACCRIVRKQDFLFPFSLVLKRLGSETGEQFLLPKPQHAAGLDMGTRGLRRLGLDGC